MLLWSTDSQPRHNGLLPEALLPLLPGLEHAAPSAPLSDAWFVHSSLCQVPGLNSPGLVPARKVPKQPKPDFETVRDNGSLNHFWNNKGIMNSVPKMKGIITPKSTCNNNHCGRFDDYTFNPKFQD